MEDEWVDIKGFEGLYQINKLGEVKSLERKVFRKDGRLHYIKKERILKPRISSYRYLEIVLYKNGKESCKKIHRLLAEHFIPNPKNLPWVDHKNHDTKDNTLTNLRWITPKGNAINQRTKGKIPHKFICEEKIRKWEYFSFLIQNRKEKNIHKRFNKKKYTLQDVIMFRNKYCEENDIEIIE